MPDQKSQCDTQETHITSLHKRVGALEVQIGEILEWKPTMTSAVNGLTTAMKQNTDVTERTFVEVNSVKRVIQGDLDGKTEGVHATLKRITEWMDQEKKTAARNFQTMLTAVLAVAVPAVGAAVVWLIRHMGQ